MTDGRPRELVNGEIVELNVSYETSAVALLLNARLLMHVLANNLGWMVQSDCGLQIFASDPRKVRMADGAFISSSRPDAIPPGEGHLRIAPDLVIEVVSPNDIASEVDVKVSEYLAAGVRLVWVLYPETKSVMIFRPDGNDTRVGTDATLAGEDVVPGFSVSVGDLFPF